MIRLLGRPRNRAHRVMWMLEELELDYELVPGFAGPDAPPSEELVRLNPNARVPVLIDGDLVLWESLAINLALAERYDSKLLPATPEGRALALQWTLWTATELEGKMLEVSRHDDPVKRVPRTASKEEALGELASTLDVLDRSLTDRDYLIEDRFTVADLNVACVAALGIPSGVDFASVPHVDAWLRERCLRRPAARSVFNRALEDIDSLQEAVNR